MFREALGVKKIVVACDRTDLRKGIDGLSALIRFQYGMDPLEGTLFLFCGGRRDRIKGLIYEGTGFCLCYMRLTDGCFQWPATPDEARDISREQYRRLMDGFTIDGTIRDTADDYVADLRRLKRHPNNRAAAEDIQSLEEFFHSKWYACLTTVDPDYLIRNLRKKVSA